ncbi:MAG TPA: sugar-binding domain-containing protein [Actinomycetes bacterium]|nr:sugar-binding domain-containing protein [Actinomycetes bacterium]
MRATPSAYEPDEVEPLVTAAIMYYQAQRSQEQIARHLKVSRPTVSRLLARARQLGIVRIEIVPPSIDPSLAKDLAEKLQMRAVHIAAGVADPNDPAPVLTGRLNDALAEIGLQAGDVIVVGWGRAIYSLARADLMSQPGVVVVPALGGSDEDRPWFQSNEIARRWAVTLEGAPRYLHAPALVAPALKRSLVGDEAIQSTLRLWDGATAAIVGMGAYPKLDRSLVATGFLAGGPEIAGAVGDVVGRFFAEDGTPIHYADERRLLAILPERLRQIPYVIGIAVGTDKARAIIGAARAGFINTLVTDTVTARSVAGLLGEVKN